jgi:hypothetical protein
MPHHIGYIRGKHGQSDSLAMLINLRRDFREVKPALKRGRFPFLLIISHEILVNHCKLLWQWQSETY